MVWLWSLVLAAPLALAQDAPAAPEADAAEPGEPAAEAPPAEAEPPEIAPAEVAPPAPPPPGPDAYRLVVTADPLKTGDDRIAKRIEVLIAELPGLGDCWADQVRAGAEPFRYQQLTIKVRMKGDLKWAKTSSSTQDEVTDACTLALVEGIVVDPPPHFDDAFVVNVTWAKPKPEDAPEG